MRGKRLVTRKLKKKLVKEIKQIKCNEDENARKLCQTLFQTILFCEILGNSNLKIFLFINCFQNLSDLTLTQACSV